MIVVLMGVSGSGKTLVGELLAARLDCGFSDADGFHPPANVEKMRAGVALEDADRWPWLAAIRAAIDAWQAAGESRVVACSALKRTYREKLSPNRDVVFVYLKGSAELLRARLDARKGHFFDPALLASQLATLEEPNCAIVVDIARPPAEIADEILVKLRAISPRSEKRGGVVE